MEILNKSNNLDRSKRIPFLWKIFVMIINSACFYGYILNNHYQLVTMLTVLSLILWAITLRKFSFYISDFYFLLFIIIFLISSVNSINRVEALKYVFSLFQLFIVMFVLQSFKNWQSYFIKMAYFFSGSHVFFSLIYYLIPNFILEIRSLILSADAYEITTRLFNNKLNAGISPQTGNNAYYIAVFIGISTIFIFQSVINKKYKKLFFHLPMFILGLSMLIATGKRGPILAIAIAILFIFIVNFYTTDFMRKNIGKLLILAVLSVIVIINTPLFESFLSLIELKEGNDLLSGRSTLWDNSLNYFNESPLLGNGLLSMRLLLGLDSHNVYIQLLAETGLAGFLFFLFFAISRLIITLKNSIKIKENIDLQISLYFQVFFLIYCFSGNPIFNLNLFLFYIIFISIR